MEIKNKILAGILIGVCIVTITIVIAVTTQKRDSSSSKAELNGSYELSHLGSGGYLELPKGPQGPPGTVLHYDLLSNSQAGINYPGGDHFGAFVPRKINHPQNNELQIYKPSQAHQDPVTSEITITAEKHKQSITSARIDTKGVWTTAQSPKIKQRGYLEVRALMPAKTHGGNLKGSWPAIWMLGANGKKWPDNGEIDIVELKNGYPNVIMTLHSTHRHGGNGQHPSTSQFRLDTDMTKIPVIFGLEWNVQDNKGQIDLTWWITSFDVPSQKWKSQHTTRSVFKSKKEGNDYSVFFESFNSSGFYLLINLAQGGDFTGVRDKAKVLVDGPQHIVVKSAKVYRIEG